MWMHLGCTAYAQIPKKKRKRIDDHEEKCIFIGYSEQLKVYKFYNSLSKKVLISCDVIFYEDAVWN